jgi:hypothetical protein
MKLRNENLKFKNFSLLMLSILFFVLTGCLENKEAAAPAVEERTIVSSGGSGSTSQNPVMLSWPALGAICSNPNATQGEKLICELDKILEKVANSGQPLQNFAQDIDNWIDDAIDYRNQVCQSSADVSFLLEGTMQVLAGRKLIALPFNNASVVSANVIHALVRKIIQAVVFDTIQMGCNIDKSKIPSIFGANGAPAAGGGSGGSVSPIAPAPGPGNGGGAVNPAPGPVVGICSSLQQKFKFYCLPGNTFDAANCAQVKQACAQNNCVCN